MQTLRPVIMKISDKQWPRLRILQSGAMTARRTDWLFKQTWKIFCRQRPLLSPAAEYSKNVFENDNENKRRLGGAC